MLQSCYKVATRKMPKYHPILFIFNCLCQILQNTTKVEFEKLVGPKNKYILYGVEMVAVYESKRIRSIISSLFLSAIRFILSIMTIFLKF